MSCMLCSIPGEKPEEVIAGNDDVYVVVPAKKHPLTNEPITWDPASYRLVVPRRHAESISELVGVWDAVMLEAERQKEVMGGDVIVSFNLGMAAGQTKGHLHVWVVRCVPGQPSSGKGTATLKELVDALLS